MAKRSIDQKNIAETIRRLVRRSFSEGGFSNGETTQTQKKQQKLIRDFQRKRQRPGQKKREREKVAIAGINEPLTLSRFRSRCLSLEF